MAYVKSIQFKNTSTDSLPFVLEAGQYGMMVNATFGGGSVTLQRLSADTSTYVTVLAAFSAAGYATVNLPYGTYKVAIATATAVYAEIAQVVKAD